MTPRGSAWGLAMAALAGCAVGADDGSNTYGNITYPVTTAQPSGSGGTGDGDTGSSSGEGTSDSPSSDATGTPVSSGTGSSTDEGGTTLAASDTADVGPQPADGMYSDCLMAAQCVGLNTCVTILDLMDMPIDGFCTNNGCTRPAVDCDPTPAGTAVPFCMEVTLNGSPDTACALDCSGGAICPGGMMCWDLDGTFVCS